MKGCFDQRASFFSRIKKLSLSSIGDEVLNLAILAKILIKFHIL